jgi:hypothetical protein
MTGQNNEKPIYTGKILIVVSPTLSRNFEIYEISSTEIELRFNDGYPARRIHVANTGPNQVREAVAAVFPMKVILD